LGRSLKSVPDFGGANFRETISNPLFQSEVDVTIGLPR
jgi:hypothetical protein